MNKVVITSSQNIVKHYGIKGMKWDEKKVRKRTDQLEDLVEKTVAKADTSNPVFQWVISDEKINNVEAQVQTEKEKVDAKIKKAEIFLKKQKDIEASDAVFKFLAPAKKRQAVEHYLEKLKVSSTTLTKLKQQMAQVKRKKKKAMR